MKYNEEYVDKLIEGLNLSPSQRTVVFNYINDVSNIPELFNANASLNNKKMMVEYIFSNNKYLSLHSLIEKQDKERQIEQKNRQIEQKNTDLELQLTKLKNHFDEINKLCENELCKNAPELMKIINH